jgi:hypothetical protein
MRVQENTPTIPFDNFDVNTIKKEDSRNTENIGPNVSGNILVKIMGDITISNVEFARNRNIIRYHK